MGPLLVAAPSPLKVILSVTMDKFIVDSQNSSASNDDQVFFTPYNVDIDNLGDAELKNYLSKISIMPQKLRKVIIGFSSAEFIVDSLGPKFNLSLKQKEAIARTARDVAMGELYIGDMPSQIAVQMGVGLDRGREIANATVNGLFVSVLDDLKKIQKEKFGDKASTFGSVTSKNTESSSSTTPSPGPAVSPSLPSESSDTATSPTTQKPPVPASPSPPATPPPTAPTPSSPQSPNINDQNQPKEESKKYNVVNLKDM